MAPIDLTSNKEIIKLLNSKSLPDKKVSNPGQITFLDKKTYEKFLKTKKKLSGGATSTVYVVNNIFTNKKNDYLCLKIINEAVIQQIGEQEGKPKKSKGFNKDTFWDDDFIGKDDDDENDQKELNFESIQLIFKEYELLNNLNHPNIVKVYGFYRGDEDNNPAILMELCKGDLEKIIGIKGLLDNGDLVAIIYEICSAMKYVHSKNVIHRDLKMKNILINRRKHAVISDFGLSKVMDLTSTTMSMTHSVGTFHFMAPELFNTKIKYTEKVDVYAFGVILYFILTKGQKPEYTGPGCYEGVNIPKSINKLSKKIIQRCWLSNPEKRPSFASIIKAIEENNFLLIDGIEKEVPRIKKFLGLK